MIQPGSVGRLSVTMHEGLKVDLFDERQERSLEVVRTSHGSC
ncbi:hypothetical protein ACVOMV_06900 [Mesorhizobium atlanticum]